MEFEIAKGMRDIKPSEQIKINKVLDIIRKNFEQTGFRPFDTPTLEHLSTLTNKYNEEDEIVQEIFKVSDRGNRKLGLRYDLTVPLCRYIAGQKQIKLPFRRYHIGKVFRDGPIKPGRLREFVQCDADVIGIEGRYIEAELLSLFSKTYQEIGINAVIEINNNKILRGAFLEQGFKEEELQALILSVDKLKKIGKEGVIKEISEKGFNTEKAKKAVELLMLDLKTLEKKANSNFLKEGINELLKLKNLLDELEVKYRINLSMSRGLNYYTGNIWEAYDINEKIKSSIGSGGRYDSGIGNYIGDGREFPALGISFGLIPILECLPEEENKESNTKTLIVPLNENLIIEAIKLARKIKNNGENTEIYHGLRLKKAFDYAEYLGIEEIAILGEEDYKNGNYTLKNLKTKKEEKIKL